MSNFNEDSTVYEQPSHVLRTKPWSFEYNYNGITALLEGTAITTQSGHKLDLRNNISYELSAVAVYQDGVFLGSFSKQAESESISGDKDGLLRVLSRIWQEGSNLQERHAHNCVGRKEWLEYGRNLAKAANIVRTQIPSALDRNYRPADFEPLYLEY